MTVPYAGATGGQAAYWEAAIKTCGTGSRDSNLNANGMTRTALLGNWQGISFAHQAGER